MKGVGFPSTCESDPDVYHDHSDRAIGQQIPSQNKVNGTGGFPRWRQCIHKA